MIDPETQETPTQLPLPAGFLEPGPSRRPAESVPPLPTSPPQSATDTAIEELIRHFRAVECRRESVRTRPSGLAALLERWRRKITRRPEPPRPSADIWPRLSVIMPVLDPVGSLRGAIDSLLEQRYPDLELILVSPFEPEQLADAVASDEARIIVVSIDGTADVVSGLRRGFARASGEILCWIEPSTVMLPGCFARVGAHFASRDAAAVLSMDVVREISGWRFAAEPGFDPAALFVSRLAYDVVGGLDAIREETSSPKSLAAALAGHIGGRYGLRHLAIHAAVVGRGSRDIDSADPVNVAWDPPATLWFVPDTTDAVPVQEFVAPATPPPSPIDGTAPDRLLFASPDTRFGSPGLHDIWYHAAGHCTTTAPVVDRSEVRRLAAQQPPLSERRIIEPEAGTPSPWRDWRFGARILAFALDHPLPGWLLDRWPLKHLIGWTDRTGLEIEEIVRGLRPPPGKDGVLSRDVLEIGCHSGDILDHLHRQGWKTHGTEINVAAAEAARAKGHVIWTGAPDDLLQTVPIEQRFDLVFLGHVVERQADPLALVQRAARLLKPTGLLVIATPNLDSTQIALFGPTWAHWHPPHHRTILSRRTLDLMAAASGLRLRRCRSWSHPYWTWLSVRLNRAGLAGIVPNGIVPDSETRSAVETLILAARLLDDWRGRGDYLYAALSPDLRV